MKILDVDEFNKIVGKSLEECREEISDSFYRGAKLMIDKVNEMAEEKSMRWQRRQTMNNFIHFVLAYIDSFRTCLHRSKFDSRDCIRKEQTMSRWICVDDICIPSDENDWEELVAFADAIAEQEPIDIVRCKECRRVREDGGHANCNGYLYCRKWKTLVDEDCFCSWGERRE